MKRDDAGLRARPSGRDPRDPRTAAFANACLTTVEFDGGHAIVSRVLDVQRDAKTFAFDIARDGDANAGVVRVARARLRDRARPYPDRVRDGRRVADRARRRARRGRRPADDRSRGCSDARGSVPRCRSSRRSAARCFDEHGYASPGQAIDLSGGGRGRTRRRRRFGAGSPGADHELILSLPDVGRLALDATLRTVRPRDGHRERRRRELRLGFRFEAVPPKTVEPHPALRAAARGHAAARAAAARALTPRARHTCMFITSL